MANTCSTCLKPKANHICGHCQEGVCKNCAQFVDEEPFSYFKRKPAILSKSPFCQTCFNSEIQPLLDSYEEIMGRAREVYIFDDTQGKESREFKRDEPALEITDCSDREETVMRLAFLAAEAGFNGLVDLSVSKEKVRNHGFQNMKWHGSAIPTQIDPKKLNRNKAFL